VRPGGGKSKGAAYEREVCRRLSLYVTGGKRDDVFWRSAMSGGRATIKGIAHVAGDICAVHPDGYDFASRWFVECKHYRDLQLHRFLIQEGRLWNFWIKAGEEAEKHYKLPLLIVKQNGFPELLIKPNDFGATMPSGDELFIVGAAHGFLLRKFLGEDDAKRSAHQRPAPHHKADRQLPVGAVPVARRGGEAKARPKVVRAR